MMPSRVLAVRLMMAALCLPFLAETVRAETDATAVVDWTKPEGTINRALFSTQGFMQVYVEPDPMVMDTFLLLNPEQTHTRLETYIHKMEPQNDNDDPNTFNWSAFKPQEMIRFIDDRRTFENFAYGRLGMEPLSLLCYMVDWNKTDNESDPIRSKEEWAEYAAAVVESYNGREPNQTLRLRMVEVWNEPNMKMFYTGSMESYFELFKITADRLHRDYPGVLVGGPALTHAPECKPEEWMVAFIKECGDRADYLSYHPYGESVDKIIADIKRWSAEFRKIPGKENGLISLTETDFWQHGWQKYQYVFDRQFRFLEIQDLILDIHHFCCLSYREHGNYTFGIVDKQGAVIGDVFWPYWLFRNLIGERVHTMRIGARQGDFDLAASRFARGDRRIATAVFHNKSAQPITIRAILHITPEDAERVLEIDRVAQARKGVAEARKVASGESQIDLALALEAGEGAALHLRDAAAEPIFGFRDLNNQSLAWMDAAASKERVALNETWEFKVRLLNTTTTPLSGTITVRGLPADWTIEVASGNATVGALPFGASKEVTFRVTTTSLIDGEAVAPVAVLEPPTAVQPFPTTSLPHSIPVRVEAIQPLRFVVAPVPVFAVRGEKNRLTLQIENLVRESISGEIRVESPAFLAFDGVEPRPFAAGARSMKREMFEFAVAPDAPVGDAEGKFQIRYMGTMKEIPFRVSVGAETTAAKATPLDLTAHLNFDAAAFDRKRTDYDPAMGMFTYPADFTPGACVQNVRGVPLLMPSLDDGKRNAILPQGQKIPVQPGNYQGVVFLGFGYDGKHPGTWIYHYADGSTQNIASQIPEWCTPPPDGFQVAMTAPHRYISGGPAPPACELFMWTLAADPAKQLVAVELPKLENAHIFAMTLLGKE